MPGYAYLLLGLIVAVVIASAAISVVRERRRLEQQHTTAAPTYGTVEATPTATAPSGVTDDMLRELRDRKGPIEAVRALRKANPGMPLDEATRIVTDL